MLFAHTFSNYGLWQTSSIFFNLNGVFWPLWCLLWKLFFNTKEVVENTNFWNKAILPEKKYLGHFSCNILTKKKIMEQPICVCKVLLVFCGNCRISSIGPKGSIANFFQKKAIVPLKSLLAHFFSNYRPWHTSSNFLLGFTKFFGIYSANYEIISLTPKKLLKTCVFEKCYLSNEQLFAHFFL